MNWAFVIPRIVAVDVRRLKRCVVGSAAAPAASEDAPSSEFPAPAYGLNGNHSVLVSAGTLRPLGRPIPNAVKFFSAVELTALLADREWLDDATKTIGQYWRRKNAWRNGFVVENPTNDSTTFKIFQSF